MSFLGNGPSIILYHILPSILGAFIYYILAKLFIFVFRIKRPNLKYFIYLLVLYKSTIILITGARYTKTMVPRKSFGLGTMFYDPLDLIPYGSSGPIPDVSFQAFQSPWLVNIVAIIVIVIVLLVLLRWIATVIFFKNLVYRSKPLGLNMISFIDNVCSKFKITVPRIVITKSDLGPMTIGVIKPTIVLPEWIIRSFSKQEIEVIIGHELAHVKRRDNLFQWIALFLKDIMFFSPFSKLAYNFLQSNKEQAADSLFLKIMPDKSSLLRKTIKKVASKPFTKTSSAGILIAKANFIDLNIIQKRIGMLDHNTKLSSKFITTSLNVFGLLLFFWMKAWISIKVGQEGLMLLS